MSDTRHSVRHSLLTIEAMKEGHPDRRESAALSAEFARLAAQYLELGWADESRRALALAEYYKPCDHNEIPIRKWFRSGWMCVRCNTWSRGRRGRA